MVVDAQPNPKAVGPFARRRECFDLRKRLHTFKWQRPFFLFFFHLFPFASSFFFCFLLCGTMRIDSQTRGDRGQKGWHIKQHLFDWCCCLLSLLCHTRIIWSFSREEYEDPFSRNKAKRIQHTKSQRKRVGLVSIAVNRPLWNGVVIWSAQSYTLINCLDLHSFLYVIFSFFLYSSWIMASHDSTSVSTSSGTITPSPTFYSSSTPPRRSLTTR